VGSAVENSPYLVWVKDIPPPYALVIVSLLPLSWLVFTSCESPAQQNGPLPTGLEGRWHYDSSRTTLYDAQSRLSSTFKDAIRPGALLTIGSGQWRYTGSLREEHAYTRQGDTLSVCRVGDQHLVDLHYISPDGIGKVIGHPHQIVITNLTAHQLVVRDSTRASDGIRVSHLYHSR
jgi:hypothetical protein